MDFCSYQHNRHISQYKAIPSPTCEFHKKKKRKKNKGSLTAVFSLLQVCEVFSLPFDMCECHKI